MKTKQFTIGKCGYCEEMIFSDEKWEALYYARPFLGKSEYTKGPVHKKCRLPALKRFTKELMKDVETLEWMLGAFVNYPTTMLRKPSP